jgi:hypothetical protein
MKIKFKNNAITALILILGLACFSANAKELNESGEFIFGPQVSQQDACDAAEKRAINAAIRKINGESINAEEQSSCKEETDVKNKKENYQCVFNQNTWSQLDGIVRKKYNRTEEINTIEGAKVCKVTLTVDIEQPAEQPDVNFNFTYEINKKMFRDGETIQFSIKPSMAMYINIFSYLPYMQGNQQVTKLYPNIFEKQKLVTEKIKIPSDDRYSFIVNWLENRNKEKTLQDEHYMIIATKEPIKWLDEYTIEKFHSVLREIKPSKMRKATGTYIVLRSY